MTLLGIGFTQILKIGVISPTSYLNGGSFPGYIQASSDQRKYGFVGLKVGTSIAQMSNGDGGYYVGP